MMTFLWRFYSAPYLGPPARIPRSLACSLCYVDVDIELLHKYVESRHHVFILFVIRISSPIPFCCCCFVLIFFIRFSTSFLASSISLTVLTF